LKEKLVVKELRKAIALLKKNKIEPLEVLTKEQALQMSKNDPTGSEWRVGDKYFLAKINENITLALKGRERVTKRFFKWYDRNSRWSYFDDKIKCARDLKYSFLSEAIYYEYVVKKKTLEIVGKELGFFSSSGTKYHIEKMQFFLGTKLLRNRGGSYHRSKVFISRSLGDQIKKMVLEEKKGYRQIGRELSMKPWTVRHYIYRLGIKQPLKKRKI